MSSFIENFSDIFIVLLILPLGGLVVFAVHEAGHYIAARIFGLPIQAVSVGYGRAIWERRGANGTLWVVRLFPFCGHVSVGGLAGEEGRGFSLWRRSAVILAGPAVNFILPLVLLFLFYATAGMPAIPAVVTGVDISQPAYAAGILPGDKILAVGGKPIAHSRVLTELMKEEYKAPLVFSIGREDRVFDVSILPVWRSYLDNDGVERTNSRIGVLLQQTPYKLSAVKTVNGAEAVDEDAARAMIVAALGQRSTVGLKSEHLVVREYIMDLDRQKNADLSDPDAEDYDVFFPGGTGDNFYLPLSVAGAVKESAKRTAKMIGGIVRAPFNLFPIDNQDIKPDAVVTKRTAPVSNRIFMLIHLICVLSVCIGIVNLVPFPGFDGSLLLVACSTAAARRTLTRKEQALLHVGALLVLYGAVFTMNAPGLPGYFTYRIESIQEYFEGR